jgi:hypothetical protein
MRFSNAVYIKGNRSNLPVLYVAGLILAILLAGERSAQANPPTLTAMPGSGPAGTLVLLSPLGKPPVKDIAICPENQPCVKIPFRGISPVVFAIPKNLAPNVNYDISITYVDNPNSHHAPDTSSFTVLDVPRPASLDSFELGVNRLTDGTTSGLQLVLFGKGFDLANFVSISQGNGHKIYKTFMPGIEHQKQIRTSPLDRALPKMCGQVACAERVRIAVIDEAYAGPGLHTIILMDEKKNPLPNVSSLTVEFPQRTLLVKLDRIEQTYEGSADRTPSWPLFLISRIDAPSSLGQAFSALGYRIDLWQDKGFSFPIERGLAYDCPFGAGITSPGMELADVIDVARQSGTLPTTGVSPDSWYVHANILNHLVPSSGFTAYGLNVASVPNSRLDHAEVAIFSRSVCDPLSLRTLMHELGHALKLTHCDGDQQGLTLMNQAQCIDNDHWQLQFSGQASAKLVKALKEENFPPQPTEVTAIAQEQTTGSCCLMFQSPTVTLPDLSQLQFTLAAPTEQIVSGATVSVKAMLTNSGTKTVDILPFFDPSYGITDYVIKRIDQDGFPPSHFAPLLSYDGSAEPKPLAGGGSVKDDEVVISSSAIYMFSPGKYQIQGFFHGALSSLGVPSGEIASNLLEINVREPKLGAEAALSRFLLQPETRLFILAHGGESYGDLPQQLDVAIQAAAQNELPRIAQEAALVLSEYYNRSGTMITGQTRAADYEKARDYLGMVARGPQLSKSASVRFHTERALALGALKDTDGSNEDLQFLKELPEDPLARQGLERVHRILNTVGETNLGVDLSALRTKLAQSCNSGEWRIEPPRQPTVTVKGPLVQLATAPVIPAQGTEGLTLLGRSSTEALFAIGMKAPEGLEVKSSAWRLRVKVKPFKSPLVPENFALPNKISDARIELPLLLPCFLSEAMTGLQIPVELDAKSIHKIEQWHKGGPLSLDLKVTLPTDLTRFGGKIGGPIAFIPP